MKRPVFIIIGAVLVLILLAVWIYVLFFSTPNNNSGGFANLDFGNTNDPTVVVAETEAEEPVVDVTGPEKLRQLTTKPTAGYQEVTKTASSTPEVFYIESGTGHIFSIDLASGEEKRVSATTIPSSYRGVITPNGQFAMIQSGSGASSEFIVGELSSSSDSLSNQKLDEQIIDFAVTADNTFLYAVQTGNSVIANEYDPKNETREQLFTIPFRETAFSWGSTASDIHYVYPKANSLLEGFVLRIEGSDLRRLPIDGYGLSATGNDSSVVYSKKEGEMYQTFAYNLKSGQNLKTAITLLPEKCEPSNDVVICASSDTMKGSDAPDNWYKGVTTLADDLWELDTESGGATYLLNTTKESGRKLDMINLTVNNSGDRVYFTNKNDGALWLFERN